MYIPPQHIFQFLIFSNWLNFYGYLVSFLGTSEEQGSLCSGQGQLGSGGRDGLPPTVQAQYAISG